jgi:hypothetical protein
MSAGAADRPRAAARTRLDARRLAAALLVLGAAGCVAPQQRAVVRSSRALAREVAAVTHERKAKKVGERGPPAARAVAGLRHVAPAERSSLDLAALRAQRLDAPSWSNALRHPSGARPEALLELSPGPFVAVVWTDEGWRFAEDPTQPYAASTPRQAFAAFVRASQDQRWDVLVDLAPVRLRAGLTPAAVEAAWTSGDGAASLRAARDRLERALTQTILEDGDSAALEVAPGAFARAERERDRWVVVDVP